MATSMAVAIYTAWWLQVAVYSMMVATSMLVDTVTSGCKQLQVAAAWWCMHGYQLCSMHVGDDIHMYGKVACMQHASYYGDGYQHAEVACRWIILVAACGRSMPVHVPVLQHSYSIQPDGSSALTHSEHI